MTVSNEYRPQVITAFEKRRTEIIYKKSANLSTVHPRVAISRMVLTLLLADTYVNFFLLLFKKQNVSAICLGHEPKQTNGQRLICIGCYKLIHRANLSEVIGGSEIIALLIQTPIFPIDFCRTCSQNPLTFHNLFFFNYKQVLPCNHAAIE